MADTPETSDYTSIKQRIKAVDNNTIPAALCRFQGAERKGQKDGIPCSLKDYIELVDVTGRAIRQDKRGAIAASQSPILQRLKIDSETWLYIATRFEDSCGPWVGSRTRIAQACESTGKHWVCESKGSQILYPP